MKNVHILMLPLPEHGFPNYGVLSLAHDEALELAFTYIATEMLWDGRTKF